MALAKDPSAFSMTKTQIDALATSAIMSKLKEKGLSLASLRAIATALGDQDFRFLISSMPAKEAKALAKIDAKHPEFKTADEHWHRSQIIRLARGEIQPTISAQNLRHPIGVPRLAAPKIGKIMSLRARQASGGKSEKTAAQPVMNAPRAPRFRHCLWPLGAQQIGTVRAASRRANRSTRRAISAAATKAGRAGVDNGMSWFIPTDI
jgi:hypothetical protein